MDVNWECIILTAMFPVLRQPKGGIRLGNCWDRQSNVWYKSIGKDIERREQQSMD